MDGHGFDVGAVPAQKRRRETCYGKHGRNDNGFPEPDVQ